jgi:hypothetical protein
LPKDWDDLYKLKPQTNLAAGNNLNLDGQHSPNIEKSIDNAFSGDIPLPKNEEIPPALAPLWNVADFLDKYPTNSYNENTTDSIQKTADKTKNNPYAEYLGKGGTIYVHVFDVAENRTYTDIENTEGNLVLPTIKHYKRAAQICNEKFKKINVNLTVEIHFGKSKKGEKPLTAKEFQKRKNYNITDSYVVIGLKDPLQKWEEDKYHQHKKDTDPTDYSMGQWSNANQNIDKAANDWHIVGVETVGTSSQSQFYAQIIVETFRSLNSKFGYQQAANIFGADEAIAMAIAKFIQHETGHPKFDRHPNDDATTPQMGGHLKGTIMQEYPTYGFSEDYDSYQVCILQELHGRLLDNIKISKSAWISFLKTDYLKNSIEFWGNKSWADIGKSMQDLSYSIILEVIEAKAYSDIISIFDMRTDLPKANNPK